MNWLRTKIRNWLGIDDIELCAVAAENHAKELHREVMASERVMIDLSATSRNDTVIIVASELGGGKVHAMSRRFGSIREFQDFMDNHFPGWRKRQSIHDLPYDMKSGRFEFL